MSAVCLMDCQPSSCSFAVARRGQTTATVETIRFHCYVCSKSAPPRCTLPGYPQSLFTAHLWAIARGDEEFLVGRFPFFFAFLGCRCSPVVNKCNDAILPSISCRGNHFLLRPSLYSYVGSKRAAADRQAGDA
jgi:hypothetical protein